MAYGSHHPTPFLDTHQHHQAAATSRHFLAASIQRVRFLPVPAAACVVDDHDASSLPIALAVWSEDAQRHALTLGDVVAVGPSSEMARFDVRGMAPHRGAVADLRAARCAGAVVVAAAGAAGGVAVLRLGLGALPAGADAADLEPPQMDLDDEGFLRPAAALPSSSGAGAAGGAGGAGGAGAAGNGGGSAGAPVASVDLHGATGRLLAAGGEGALLVQALGAGPAPAYREGVRGWGGFTQARWVDSHTFATTGIAGGLSLWDTRAPGRAGPVRHASGAPPASSSSAAGAAGDVTAAAARQTLCLDVHPSRPYLAATGGAGGCPVALWDLRAMACAAAMPPPAVAGGAVGLAAPDVWEVRFDPSQQGGGEDGGGGPASASASATALPPLLFCTSDGGVWRASAAALAGGGGGGGGIGGSAAAWPQLLMREEASVNSFDVEGALGRDLVAASDNECLMFQRRGGLLGSGMGAGGGWDDGGGGGGGLAFERD